MNLAENFYDRAVALHNAGRFLDAVTAYDQAIALHKNHTDAYYGRGIALWSLGRLDEGLASTDRALALNPRFFQALHNRGTMLQRLRRPKEALASFDAALKLKPDFPQVLNNMSVTLRDLGRLDEALKVCDRAIAVEPRNAAFHYNRGLVLDAADRPMEAIAAYERTLALDPRHPHAFGNIAGMASRLCDWVRMEALAPEMERRVREKKSPITPFIFMRYSGDLSLQLACTQTAISDQVREKVPPLWKGESYDHDKIRVAYLSADFRNHATSFLTAGLFEAHNRARFEVHGFCFNMNDGSEIYRRILAGFDHFHDVRARDEEDVARLLRSLEIDVAVDLMGHTRASRVAILSRRPCPVQINYLGYPGSMGADFIDYILADAIVAPFTEQRFYSEKIVHLPFSYQVNDSKRTIGVAPTRVEAGLPEHDFVFCCFNNQWKITRASFDVWMRLLAAVPGSVLWLLIDNPDARRNLREAAQTRGVDPTRLVFAARVPLDVHLARHRLADLFVDTLPYNAHTTGSDALWAGLPLVTCKGTAFAGRVAASLLHAVGLSELVTENWKDYEALALALAQDPERMRTVRQKLARNLSVARLFDTAGFARDLESAYERMLARAESGAPPERFAVSAPPQSVEVAVSTNEHSGPPSPIKGSSELS